MIKYKIFLKYFELRFIAINISFPKTFFSTHNLTLIIFFSKQNIYNGYYKGKYKLNLEDIVLLIYNAKF